MSYMFAECKSLKSIPNKTIWNIDNVLNKENMFENCPKLKKFSFLSFFTKEK